MGLNYFISTEGSLISNISKNKNFYILKKDPWNNYLWKSVKKTSDSLDKNKKLSTFKKRLLSL
jgi:hypothetical protein